ncbi:uncharacterized protein LOC112637794 [Camponotus floridanus]|uniref:uncharacterized protein LOC112637794 n=1 Tax=Camponotus floridanus TaxID=104421 RepID=UPI000DC66C81|nr:uncharacterized protein LOC112637794 [Camponotus floridanus]
MSSSQPSLSYNVTNILEPHTSSKHQTFEQIELENDPKNMQEIIKIHKRSDIRERITNLLNLSKRFMPAAEKFLAKKDNLETVLQQYQINSIDERRILHNIIFILEEHNTYLQEKINYENAVNSILFSGATIRYAAQQYNINPVLIFKNNIYGGIFITERVK